MRCVVKEESCDPEGWAKDLGPDEATSKWMCTKKTKDSAQASPRLSVQERTNKKFMKNS